MNPPEWRISDRPVPYPEAVAMMEAHAAAIRDAGAPDLVWLLEHPPLYTAGTSAKLQDLVDPNRFPVFRTGRGGQYTYHGPGQRIGYVMLDLKRRGQDVRAFVNLLEDWIIDALATSNIRGERRDGRVGVWVRKDDSEAKIAAIGVRVRRWVSFHGVSLNVDCDLSHYAGIVPCGVRDFGVTSMLDLGVPISMPEIDAQLRVSFDRIFGGAALPAAAPAGSPAAASSLPSTPPALAWR